MIERANIIKDTKYSNDHELAIKTQNKESPQPVNKIAILKPNPKGGLVLPKQFTVYNTYHQNNTNITHP
jgi:hypothetical protein